MSLTSNNASLQQILESINALPDAENSGGGGVTQTLNCVN